ncbi:MAG: T9SS type A sorting domain-containing protein, partial [Prevotellaceae bacterium]|nr:T9SS type A sorting domain-containing protein [Prevotellaceae bacterium]
YVPAIGTTYETADIYIISTDLPYTYNNKTYTQAGTYIDDLRSFAGCDSVLTVNLKVLETQTVQEEERVLCEGGYVLFHGDTIRATGSYSYHLSSQVFDYDSIVYNMDVIVNPLLRVAFNDNSFVSCGGDNVMYVDYTLQSGRPSQVKIMYSQQAQQAGLNDVDYFIVENPLPVDVPDTVHAGIFGATLRFIDDCGYYDVPLNFVVNYPVGIITQRWNDVLSIVNAQTQEKLLYNGKPNSGDVFSSYQWYKDGVKIDGAVGSYIYVPEGLDMNACYQVALTRVGETDTIFTCEFCPVPIEGDLVVSINPNPVPAGAPLKVETPESALVSVFNLQGMKIADYQIDKEKNTLTAPLQVGIYLYKMTFDSGEVRTFRISVK